MANLSLSYLILAACVLLLVQLELTASQRVFQASRPVLTPPFAFCFRENKKTKRVVSPAFIITRQFMYDRIVMKYVAALRPSSL